MFVTIAIKPKDVVHDLEGDLICERVQSAGYQEVKKVRLGKLVQLEVVGADESSLKSRVERLCKALLANPNSEDFEIISIEDS